MENSTAGNLSLPDLDGQSALRIDVRRWMESDASKSTQLHISEPQEVACFSRGADRKVQYGDRCELKRYHEPALGSNLGDSMHDFVPKADEVANVDTILEALEHGGYDRMEEIDFVTFRNNLNKIGSTPYDKRRDWEMDCAMVGNTVFLDIRRMDEDTPNLYVRRFMYYGYRFEAICTGVEQEPVNANSEFCSIARLRLGNHRIIMSAEIDCTAGDPKNVDKPVRSYIELKTMREIRSEKELGNMYRYRFPKYWIQSYLAGVRHIALGLRSDNGELLAVKRLETHRLHREAREFFNERRMRGCWEPFACLNFINFVLNSVRRACGKQSGSTLRLRYNAKTDIIEGGFLRDDESNIGARMTARFTA